MGPFSVQDDQIWVCVWADSLVSSMTNVRSVIEAEMGELHSEELKELEAATLHHCPRLSALSDCCSSGYCLGQMQ